MNYIKVPSLAFNLLEDALAEALIFITLKYVFQIREWCESNGFTEHGPYGGNGLEGSGGEEDY